MLRSQRALVFFGLLVAAFMLHVLLCDWRWKRVFTGSPDYSPPVVTCVQTERPGGPGQAWRTSRTGIFAARWISGGDAIVFGIVLPFVLLGLDGYLLLGWRHAARLERGACPVCGYDLRGAPPEVGPAPGKGCPECGWGRSTT
jgi:hypothetical protein